LPDPSMATAFPVGTWDVPVPPTTFTHRVLADEFIFRTNGSYEVLEVVMAGSPSFACQLPLVPAPVWYPLAYTFPPAAAMPSILSWLLEPKFFAH